MDPAAYYAQQGGVPAQVYSAAAAAAAAAQHPLQQGYALPGMQAQYQPIRLARYPGEALHGPPQGMVPMYPALPGPSYQAGIGLGGVQSLQPQLTPMGMRPSVYLMQQGQYQAVAGPRPLGNLTHAQLPGFSRAPASGMATPTRHQSGSTTPVHPTAHHRAPSGPATVSYSQQQAQLVVAAAQQQQQQQLFQAQPVPGPPGVNLPESLLSPSSPEALRQQGQQQPSPTRAGLASQQAQQLVPLGRVGSAQQMAQQQQQQGGSVDLAGLGSIKGGGGLGPKRVGSAHSMANSVAASVRTLGGGKQPRLGAGHASAPASRAGSASKKSAVGDNGLDEFDNIKVAVRVRPPNTQELARADQQALFINPNDYRQIQLAVPGANGSATARNFTFHACLGPTSRQADVVRLCGITQLLDAALDGFNTTIMAYGQTGSGKTYTMSGHEDVIMDDGYQGDSDDGIMTRSAVYLFEQMQRRNDGCKYSFRVSYLEIYNEAVYDLLKWDKKQLQVRWDAVKGFHVPDLHVKECVTVEELLKAISRGMHHRRVGSHELNLESSRSHSIMTIYCDCTPLRPDDHEFGSTRYGKVSLVDLAGSERVRDSKSAGGTLKETTNINRSLFMLGKVISSLAEGAQGARVPYRESKLTKLLMDSLGGSSLSLIIACCSPSAAHVEETLSTLTYASRAKNIRNQPIQQVDPQEAAISALKREVRLLRAENAYLREQLFQANMPRGQPASRLGSHLAEGPGQALPSGMATPFAAAPPSVPATADPAQALVPGPTDAGAGPLAPMPMPAGAAGLGGGFSIVGGASRPGSAGIAAAAAAAGEVPLTAAQASSVTSEELLRRLLEAQRMLVQFSRENGRLAGENGRLRAGKNLVATDYQGALEEVEWLRAKLESLETSLLQASLEAGGHGGLSGLVRGTGAGPGAGGSPRTGAPLLRSKAEVLQEAHAAVEAAGGEELEALAGGAASAAAALAAAADEAMAAAMAGGEAAGAEPVDAGGEEKLSEGEAGSEQYLAAVPAAGEALGAGAGVLHGGRIPAGPPLIAPELLADPSELNTAGTAGRAQAPHVQEPGLVPGAAGIAAGGETGGGEGRGTGEQLEEGGEEVLQKEGCVLAATTVPTVVNHAGAGGKGPGAVGGTAFVSLAQPPPKQALAEALAQGGREQGQGIPGGLTTAA